MSRMSRLRAGWRIQRRVIWALLMREVITRFGRENLGVLWMMGEPMLFTLGVAGLWTAAGLNHGRNISIIAFAVTGYSSVLLWRNAVSKCNAAISQNFNLLYHRNVRVLDLFVARILLEVGGATASFLALFMVFATVGLMDLPSDPAIVLLGWVLLIWLGAGLAMFIGAATAYSEIVDRLWHPVQYLLFPLSGAAFMVDWLPPVAQEVVLCLPMVHGVEMIRSGFFSGQAHPHYDIGYMVMCNMVLTTAALVLVRHASARVEAP